MEKIGVIGCGLMGSGIAANLLKNDFTVYVFDINKEAVEKLAKEGAIAVEQPKYMAGEVDAVILSLPTPELVKKTVADDDAGIIHFMRQGTTILDMSTNDVEVTRNLYQLGEEKEIEFFDCPLSGGPTGAANGTLTVMIGGKEEAFPAILPILQAIGEHIEYVGESGAGQTAKLCHNMVVGGVITLLSEAFVTGEKAGVSKETLASILQKGSAQTRAMDIFGVNILKENFSELKFSLANMTKDILLYRNLSETSKVPALASQSAIQLFQMANYQGKGNHDAAAVYELFAGTEGQTPCPSKGVKNSTK
ncbi:NAD(P)-dependent oxidoreductase [Virgibacillus kekensis]|uniref:NAD(P)-dependent oxidoreductase n=1 Tax=Virgibacillus kekensis TaxID=202261 RepID=A0ABV9DHF8_9BACI